MKIAEALLASVMVCATLTTTATAADTPPRWAYIEDNPNYKPPVDDGNLVRVPNSTAGYTWTQLRTRFIAPGEHSSRDRPCGRAYTGRLSSRCSSPGLGRARGRAPLRRRARNFRHSACRRDGISSGFHAT